MSAAAVEERDEDEVPALAAAAAEAAERTEKRRGRSGCVLYAALAVMIPTLIAGGVCFWFHLQDRRLAEEALARARAAGDPLTAEEFQAAFYPPSEQTDEATRRWLLATEAIERSWQAPLAKDLPDVGLQFTAAAKAPTLDERGFYAEPTLSTVARFFADSGEEAIAAIHAARRTGVPPRIACDLSGEQELALPHGGWLFVSQSLLALEAERKAVRGDLAAATEALLSIVATSDARAGDASVEGIAFRAECYRWACQTIPRMIERVDLSDAQLVQLDQELAKADLREELVRHFQAEQFRVVQALETDEPTEDEELAFLRNFPLRGADEAMAIENFQELLDGAKIDLDSAEAAGDRVKARMTPIDGSVDQLRYQIALFRVRNLDSWLCLVLQAEADRRLTRTLIACERYRLKHGSWPANLESLVPELLAEVPVDVLEGEPISFAVEGDRLELGSIVVETPSPAGPPVSNKGTVGITIEKPRDPRTDAATP